MYSDVKVGITLQMMCYLCWPSQTSWVWLIICIPYYHNTSLLRIPIYNNTIIYNINVISLELYLVSNLMLIFPTAFLREDIEISMSFSKPFLVGCFKKHLASLAQLAKHFLLNWEILGSNPSQVLWVAQSL